MKRKDNRFFHSIGLFCPLDFTDPVTYFIPVFILLIVGEIFLYQIPQKIFTKRLIKDNVSSIGLGLGAVMLDFGMKAISLSYFFWIYNHFRLTDIFGIKDFNKFFTLQWHADHWWLWLLVMIVQDFGFYWHHRLSHKIRLFWTGHVNHHSATHLSLAIALRQGWFEIIYRDIWYIPFIMIGFHPVMIAMMHQFNLIFQFWPHTNAIGKLGWFDKIFNSPSNHRVHHSRKIEDLDNNYGGILMIWDHLFGTYKAEEKKTTEYGIYHNIHTYNVFHIVFDEFGKMIKDVRNAPSWKAKLGYIFNAPGWHHHDKDERISTLKRELKEKMNN
ncbi:sterol desaturase family protein [Chryseobacterium indologenes]|uniref:Sterol desaturase family protein n=1 Tax=Chryseobacterium indologenes TaxID=253 RepID=A0A411DKZ6_CHRID|nr:sterol desaturase family protein [Chryseobacterium indologenes]